nr:hypothetical protein [Tanacetum cinerariifolium]
MIEQRSDGTLYYLDQIWVPLKGEVRTLMMDEAYKSKYFVHPRDDKMYYDLRDRYWWPGIKKDITEYVSKCLTCLKVKAENQRSFGLLQQHEILVWKWEGIAMDFVTKLPRTSSGCAPFEALYGRKYRSPIKWTEVGEGQLIGPELVQETIEKISQIKDSLKTVRDHQKSYADKRTKPLQFSLGDYVLLKVSPWKGVVRFGKKGKLAPREFKKSKRSRMAIVKVRWNSKRGPEFTWEHEDQIKLKYLHLFSDISGRISRILWWFLDWKRLDVFGARELRIRGRLMFLILTRWLDRRSIDTVDFEFGKNRKNRYFGLRVDTGKFREIPHNNHNKENLVTHVDNNYHHSSDCNLVLVHR